MYTLKFNSHLRCQRNMSTCLHVCLCTMWGYHGTIIVYEYTRRGLLMLTPTALTVHMSQQNQLHYITTEPTTLYVTTEPTTLYVTTEPTTLYVTNYTICHNRTNYTVYPNRTNYTISQQNQLHYMSHRTNYTICHNRTNYTVYPNRTNYTVYPNRNVTSTTVTYN